MLYALTFQLIATGAAELPETHGHFAHAALLALLRQEDAALATRIHDMNGAKPFTTAVLHDQAPAMSPLGQRRSARSDSTRGGPLKQGDERLLRLTLLDSALYQPLMAPFLRAGAPPEITLGAARFCVACVAATPGVLPWVGHAEPGELLARSRETDLISLEYCSPTAFSRGQSAWGKMIDLLPAPVTVFESLMGKWQAMTAWQQAAPTLPERQALLHFIEERVVVKQIEDLKTRMLRYTTNPQVGFTGTVTYQIKGMEPTRAQGGTAAEGRNGEGNMPFSTADGRRWLNALADFAFYSGVGYRTTMGMGQTRRVRV